MELRRTLFHSLLLLLTLSVLVISDSDEDCVYTIYVRTGSIIKGGTNSKISVSFYASNGRGICINELRSWGGLMGPDHDYFERGKLDIFSGRGRCLDSPICAMNLTSDGLGSRPGWYVNYVEVTSTGPHIRCHQQKFTVEEWLSVDTSPFPLTAIRDYCPKYNNGDVHTLERQAESVSQYNIGHFSSDV